MTEPEVLGVERHGDEVRVSLRIQPELRWFTGHFPGMPLLPAVVQTHWAVTFGRQYFTLPPRFTGMSHIKFMRLVTPGAHLELRLRCTTGGELGFRYVEAGEEAAGGRLRFAD